MDKNVLREVEKALLENSGDASKVNMQKLWDNYQEVAEVRKNERLKFVLAACTRDGFRCISIREFYYVKRDDAWKPGRDGIIIPLMSPFKTSKRPDPSKPPEILRPMEDMLNALDKVIDVAATMPLEDKDNALWITKKKQEEAE